LGVLALLVAVFLLTAAGGAWWYRTSRPEYRFRQGQAAASIGDFERADHYATLLEENGQADLALLLQGEILFHQGHAERAVIVLKRVEGTADQQDRAAILAAQSYLALKNPRRAEQALLFVLNHNK